MDNSGRAGSRGQLIFGRPGTLERQQHAAQARGCEDRRDGARLRRPAAGRLPRAPLPGRRLRHQSEPDRGAQARRGPHPRGHRRGDAARQAPPLQQRHGRSASLQFLHRHGADPGRRVHEARPRRAAQSQRDGRQGDLEGQRRRLRVDRLSGRDRGGLRSHRREGVGARSSTPTSSPATAPSASTPATRSAACPTS